MGKLSRSDILEAVFWLLIAVIFFAVSFSFNQPIEIYKFGATGWPRVILFLMVLVSLGLEIHEDPRFSKVSTDFLKSNYVMTVEPGIYIEDIGGVRIEDDIVITDDGCIVLNKTSKDFTVIS